MTTKERLTSCLKYYADENDLNTTDLNIYLDAEHGNIPQVLQVLGNMCPKDVRVPQIYWNAGTDADGTDYYTFVSMWSVSLGKSIILEWDSNIHKMTASEVFDDVVRIWDEAELLELRLSTLN